MKTTKQLNHLLRKYVISHGYACNNECEFGDLNLSDKEEREIFLNGLKEVTLPFISIPGNENMVSLDEIEPLIRFALENEINLQLYLEDGSFYRIQLELLEFTKNYSRNRPNKAYIFFRKYEEQGIEAVLNNSFIIKKPLLDLYELVDLATFCHLYDFDMTIYSMYDEDEEDEERNNRIEIIFTKK